MAAIDSQTQLLQDARANKAVNSEELKWLQTYHPKYNILELLPRRELRNLLVKSNSQTQQLVFRTRLPTGESVIIKMIDAAGQKLYTFDSIAHEAFIGLRGLNQLQSACFASILDFNLNGGSPYDPTVPSCNYVIYQDAGEVSLYQYLSQATPSDLLRVIVQLISALYQAYIRCGFTHYDLHLGNIMIQNGIPVMIDYGLAHIQVLDPVPDPIAEWIDNPSSEEPKTKLHHYGVILSGGGIENRSRWYHDVFKLLMALLAECTEELLIETSAADFRAQYEMAEERWASAKEDAALTTLIRGRATSIQTDRINWWARQLDRLQNQPGGLPPRPYKLKPWLQALLRYFKPAGLFDGSYLQAYRQIYPYFQPSVEMVLQGYNFEHFMGYMMRETAIFTGVVPKLI